MYRKKLKKKKIERSAEININNNQIMLVISIIQKSINRNSYISIFDNKISSYTLFNKHNLNLCTNDEMEYVSMRREITNLKQSLFKINTTKISNT